jgi:Ca2+-binding EF-hand superfamily protein
MNIKIFFSKKDKEEILDKQFKIIFNHFDLDGDGFITSEEYSKVLTSLGDKTSPEQAEILVRKTFNKI